MFNYQIVKNGKAYWFEREPKASFNIVDGKNCWHLRNFLKEELMPRDRLTNEFILEGTI